MRTSEHFNSQLNFDSINGLCIFYVIYFIRFANQCFVSLVICNNLVKQAAVENTFADDIVVALASLSHQIIYNFFFHAVGPFAFSISVHCEKSFQNRIKHSTYLNMLRPFDKAIKLIIRVTHVPWNYVHICIFLFCCFRGFIFACHSLLALHWTV